MQTVLAIKCSSKDLWLSQGMPEIVQVQQKIRRELAVQDHSANLYCESIYVACLHAAKS